MENFMWRTKARVVAYVDLAFSISMVMNVIWIIFDVHLVEYATPPTAFEKCQAWLVTAIHAVITGFKLWGSLNLLSATEFGRDINEALDKARIWRNVTFACIVMAVLFVIFQVTGLIFRVAVGAWNGSLLFAVLLVIIVVGVIGYFIWCAISLFLVYKYMKELETGLPSGGTAAGDIYLDDAFYEVICGKY